MAEYGIKVVDDQDGDNIRVILVYFSPLSYLDWVYFSSPKRAYDPSNIREIFSRYITRISIDDSKREEPYSVIDLAEDKESVVTSVIEYMIEKSGFGNDTLVNSMMDECDEKASATMAGIIDTFIGHQTGIEFYRQMLDEPLDRRIAVASMLEKITGINVRKRLKEHREEKIDLDLIYREQEHRKWKATQKGRGERPDTDQRPRPVKPENPIRMMDPEMADLIEESSKQLAETIRKSKENPSRNFDWAADEGNFV